MAKRKYDVHVEILYNRITEFPYALEVYAFKNLEKDFAKIEGITEIMVCSREDNYIISFDPRYDLDELMAEVEAVAKIVGDGTN